MSDAPIKIPVNLSGGSYTIFVRRGLLADAGPILRTLTQSAKACLVTDTTIGPRHGDPVRQSLQSASFTLINATIPAGELHKTTTTVNLIYDQLLTAKIERTTPVLALGGGVIGDITGFAAATILRGVPFVQIPTTLLAMVDASVGGKTGVNHATGKNLIGAFHQPIAVLADPETLKTLPPIQLQSGLAECIKHDIIRDADGFSHLENNIQKATALDMEYLEQLIAHNVAIKARVVEADPFERGERAHLNFGHTVGHAIESVSQFAYSHGQCVAFGMIAAARLARALGMLDDISVNRIQSVISRASLRTGGLDLPTEKIISAMSFDKKVKSGKIRFVLPDRIGHVVIRDDVPPALVEQAVTSLSE